MPDPAAPLSGLSGTLSPKEAADYLGYAPQTLAGWRFQGRGPRYLKLGKIRYRLEDLDNYLAECVTDPASVLADA